MRHPRKLIFLAALLTVGAAYVLLGGPGSSPSPQQASGDAQSVDAQAVEADGRSRSAEVVAPDIAPLADSPQAEEIRAMEAMIRDRLSGAGDFTDKAVNVQCNSAECLLRFREAIRTGGDFSSVDSRIFELFSDAFSGMHISTSAQSPGNHIVTVALYNDPTHRASNEDEDPAAFAAGLLAQAAEVLDPTDYDAPPVKIGRHNGADVMVENICSIDCPLDIERVIRLELRSDQTCGQVGGIVREIDAWSPAGIQRRVLCLPDLPAPGSVAQQPAPAPRGLILIN